MGWPKGKQLTMEHRERIREGVIRTIPIRRWRRTRAQRRADLERDWASFGTRRLTPRKPVKQTEQSVRQSVPQGMVAGVRLPAGVHLLGSGPVVRRPIRDVVERDPSGRPVEFV